MIISEQLVFVVEIGYKGRVMLGSQVCRTAVVDNQSTCLYSAALVLIVMMPVRVLIRPPTIAC